MRRSQLPGVCLSTGPAHCTGRAQAMLRGWRSSNEAATNKKYEFTIGCLLLHPMFCCRGVGHLLGCTLFTSQTHMRSLPGLMWPHMQ
jgi:hypothetical protein